MQCFISCQRKTFLQPFTILLTKRLRKEGVNCWLKSNYNYISSAVFINPAFYWKGLYLCINAACEIEYRAFIKDKPSGGDISLVVSWHGHCNHEEIEMSRRISGKERLEQGQELMIKGVTNVRAENILFNRDNVEVKGL